MQFARLGNTGIEVSRLGMGTATFGGQSDAQACFAMLDACAAPGGRYVLDISTATGKAAYAALLSAKLTNNVVTLIGTNTCTFDPTAENLSQIQF